MPADSLISLLKAKATFIEPMDCLPVSKLPEGPAWFGRAYVVDHIRALPWRSTLCGCGTRHQPLKLTELPPMLHNSTRGLSQLGVGIA